MSLFSKLARRVAKSGLARKIIGKAVGTVLPGTSGIVESKLKSYGAKSKGGKVATDGGKSLETLAEREKARLAAMLEKNPPTLIRRNPQTGEITGGSSVAKRRKGGGSGSASKRKSPTSKSGSGKKKSSSGSTTKTGGKNSKRNTSGYPPDDDDPDYVPGRVARHVKKAQAKTKKAAKTKTKRKGNAKNLNSKYSGVMSAASAEWKKMSDAEKKKAGSWKQFVAAKLRAVK